MSKSKVKEKEDVRILTEILSNHSENKNRSIVSPNFNAQSFSNRTSRSIKRQTDNYTNVLNEINSLLDNNAL